MSHQDDRSRSRLSWGLSIETERARSLLALVAIICGAVLLVVAIIVVAVITR